MDATLMVREDGAESIGSPDTYPFIHVFIYLLAGGWSGQG